MEYTNLPGTSLKLSRISLGAMMFGGQVNEADSLSIMDCAFEHGINFWDTASTYSDGESERMLGLGLKGRRDSVFVATKVYKQMGPSPMLDYGHSRRNITAALDASLKRLNTDYVDLYYLHRPDYETCWDETFDTLSNLVRKGKVHYIGLSNFAAWQIADIFALCEKRGYVAPMMTQNVYNAITRGIEPELVPFSKAHNLGMAVYNPLAGGLLTGKHQFDAPAENSRYSDTNNKVYNSHLYQNRYWTPQNFAAVEKLKKIAEKEGMTLLEFAYRWCIANKAVTTIIAGVSRLSQLQQNAIILDGPALSEEALAACDEVWTDLAGSQFAYMR